MPASCATVTMAERHQGRVQSGACHEAFTGRRTITADDLSATDRRPAYSASMVELGLHSVIGVPMQAHGQTIGVLNVYRAAPGPDRAGGGGGRDPGCDGRRLHPPHEPALRHPPAGRTAAGRAGLARRDRTSHGAADGVAWGLTADAAFAWLRKRSLDDSRKLRDVARRSSTATSRDGAAGRDRGRIGVASLRRAIGAARGCQPLGSAAGRAGPGGWVHRRGATRR